MRVVLVDRAMRVRRLCCGSNISLLGLIAKKADEMANPWGESYQEKWNREKLEELSNWIRPRGWSFACYIAGLILVAKQPHFDDFGLLERSVIAAYCGFVLRGVTWLLGCAWLGVSFTIGDKKPSRVNRVIEFLFKLAIVYAVSLFVLNWQHFI